EGGRGDDEGGRKPGQRIAHERGGVLILQAGYYQRGGGQSARVECLEQLVDRSDVGCQQRGAVKDDRDNGADIGQSGYQLVEIDRALAWQIGRLARNRLRLGRVQIRARVPCEPAQQRPQIRRSTFAEVREQISEFVSRKRRGLGEPRIV